MFALHLLRVPVTDLDAAKAFWTALLGHPPVAEEADWAHYDVDGLDIALVLGRERGHAPGTRLDFELSHDDLDKLLARLPAPAAASVLDGPDGSKRLAVEDPDGNRLVVRWRMPER